MGIRKMKKKKLYLVKREVFAYNIKQAMKERGVIYEIAQAEIGKDEPPSKDERVGFAPVPPKKRK